MWVVGISIKCVSDFVSRVLGGGVGLVDKEFEGFVVDS